MDKSKAIDRAIIRLFLKTSLREKRIATIAAFHSIGMILLNTAVPMLIGKILAGLLQPHIDPLSYMPWLILAAGGGLLGNLIGFRALMFLQARGIRHLQQQVLDVLLKRSVGFHNNNVSGKLVSDANDFPSAYQQLTGALVVNVVPLALVLVVGSVIVLSQSLLLGLIVVIMSCFTVFSGMLDRRWRNEHRYRQMRASKAFISHTADTIVNVQTVKTFAHEPNEQQQNSSLAKELLEARLSNWLSAAAFGNARLSILLGMQIGLIFAIVKLVQQDPSMLATGIFAFSFTMMLSSRLFEVNNLLRSIDQALLDAAPMMEVLLEQPEIVDKSHAKTLKVTKAKVHLRNVLFYYPDDINKQTVLNNINLSISPGEKIGLVGPSGGGKSTLTRLLLRFEDIVGGSITIDDQDIRDVTQASLRQSIAYVPQEPLLFHRSIRDNIAYGKPDASDEEVVHAAKLAYADTFISQLPDGYATIVGERGVKLSGGQRQRIAIARAILKDAPIIILDEATSALDSESEILIQKALRELMKGRTTLVIAHRLSTIQKMDRIIVLENGDVSEQGTHDELIGAKKTYARLWGHQSGGFLEEVKE